MAPKVTVEDEHRKGMHAPGFPPFLDYDYRHYCALCNAQGRDPELLRRARESAFPNTFGEGVLAALDVIRRHIPSITDAMDEGEEEPWIDLWPRDDMGDYVGDKRVCHCGLVLDGYYEYIDHLAELLSGQKSIHGG